MQTIVKGLSIFLLITTLNYQIAPLNYLNPKICDKNRDH